MGDAVLDHDGPFTERDFLGLAAGSAHVELVEGTLLVGPGATADHGAAVAAVSAALTTSLPEGLRIAHVPLRLGHDCVLVPDLVVARALPDEEDDEPTDIESEESTEPEPPDVLDSGDVLIVIDVVDRTHGLAQRSFKPQLYARSGIPYTVLIDSAAHVGAASMLINGRYHEYAAGERLVLEEPFAAEIDLAPPDDEADQ